MSNTPPDQPYPPQGGQYSPQGGQYPPQGGQPYPPQGGYYQQGPPPKKRHTVRNVLLVVGLLLILFVGGCVALIGAGANEVSKSIDKSLAEEAANDKPTPVKVGEAFEHDGYQVDAGWKVGKDNLGFAEITGVRVTNTKTEEFSSSGGRSALLTFSFYKGKENLLEINCTGNELQKGESTTLKCGGLDKLPKGYDTIKVADLF